MDVNGDLGWAESRLRRLWNLATGAIPLAPKFDLNAVYVLGYGDDVGFNDKDGRCFTFPGSISTGGAATASIVVKARQDLIIDGFVLTADSTSNYTIKLGGPNDGMTPAPVGVITSKYRERTTNVEVGPFDAATGAAIGVATLNLMTSRINNTSPLVFFPPKGFCMLEKDGTLGLEVIATAAAAYTWNLFGRVL